MEINEYDLRHQTNLVQYEMLHVHDEDKQIQQNQHLYCLDDENMLPKQELLNFEKVHDVHEQWIMIHNHRLFVHDRMCTKIRGLLDYRRKR